MKTSAWGLPGDGTFRNYTVAFIGALKTGDVVGEVEGKFESDKQMTITADIAFGEPEVFEGHALFPTLPILADHVERTISKFGPNPL